MQVHYDFFYQHHTIHFLSQRSPPSRLAEPYNRLTQTMGLGNTRTVKIRKTPVKMRFEPQYTMLRP